MRLKFSVGRKVSRLPSLVTFIANEEGVSVRTVERWCAAGKVPGAYRIKGGHWRLRKPRQIERCSGRYDDKIIELVVRYTSVPGYPLSARQAAQLNKIMRWLDENKLVPAAASILGRLVRRWADNTAPTVDWQFAEKMEKLIDGKDFNNALEFSFVLAGISDDDKLPIDWGSIPIQERGRAIRQHFEHLKGHDPKKYDLLTEPDIRRMIHTRAYEATAARNGILMTKAAKLRLNLRDVTPANLALELKISVATLYRQYGANLVKQACDGRPIHDEVPTKVLYQVSG
jgi:hypothetical protein